MHQHHQHPDEPNQTLPHPVEPEPGERYILPIPVAQTVFRHWPRLILGMDTAQWLGRGRPTPKVAAELTRLAAAGQTQVQDWLAELAQLQRSIHSRGVIEPILYVPAANAPAQVIIVDGHRRCLAAWFNGDQTIPGLRCTGVESEAQIGLVQIAIHIHHAAPVTTAAQRQAHGQIRSR